MDIFKETVALFLTLEGPKSWPEMEALFRRFASQKPRHWQLPGRACQAVGGRSAEAVPAITAVGCLQIGLLLIDDLLDLDPRGEFHRLGAPVTANLASAFQATALAAILSQDLGPERQLDGLKALNRATLTTALGQIWDIQNVVDEAAYWRIVRAKSAPFFSTALYLGALFGGAPPNTARQLERIGYVYGEMVQIHDDLTDVLAEPASPDWTQKRSTLPLLYARTVDHPERDRFVMLANQVSDPKALKEAQTILIRCGAVCYAIYQLLCRYQKALGILKECPLEGFSELKILLEDLVLPVLALFRRVGIDLPADELDDFIPDC